MRGHQVLCSGSAKKETLATGRETVKEETVTTRKGSVSTVLSATPPK